MVSSGFEWFRVVSSLFRVVSSGFEWFRVVLSGFEVLRF